MQFNNNENIINKKNNNITNNKNNNINKNYNNSNVIIFIIIN